MARKPSYKILDTQVQALEGEQDVRLVELAQQGEHKLKISIVSNAYRRQCKATISRFDGVQWHVLYSIPGDAMKTKEGLIYKVARPIKGSNAAPLNIADFAEDYGALRKRAELILF